MGVERLLALLHEAGGETTAAAVDVYLVHQGSAASRLAVRVAEGLRDQGIDVLFHCGGGGFKAQMKKADASGANFAVIIGDDEAEAGEVTLKALRANGEQPNEQKRVSVDDLAEAIMGSILDWEES
jgi:histidyl-tRNA synthetase